MPIFLDMHVSQNLTAEDVALAHQLDLKCEKEFNCRSITYWMDEKRGSAFCLIEAPNKEAVVKMHDKSHKQLPADIAEVDKSVVLAFLGRIDDPALIDHYVEENVKVFNDPAYRYLLFVRRPSRIHLMELYGAGEVEIKGSEFVKMCKQILALHEASMAEIEEEALVFSFKTLDQALDGIVELQTVLNQSLVDMDISFSLNAGNPIDFSGQIFGNTLKMGRLLMQFAKAGEVMFSSEVYEQSVAQYPELHSSVKGLTHAGVAQEEFLCKICQEICRRMNDPGLDLQLLCSELGLSKSQLYRKCVDATGMSPNQLLRELRLKSGVQMLSEGEANISRIAYDTGFNSLSYFSRCFQQRYGINPSKYASLIHSDRT